MSGQAWTMSLLFVLPRIARMTGMHHHAQSLAEMKSREFFAGPGLEL
jgi:hypothetical protein